jgi:hypothetical protein
MIFMIASLVCWLSDILPQKSSDNRYRRATEEREEVAVSKSLFAALKKRIGVITELALTTQKQPPRDVQQRQTEGKQNPA